MVASAEGIDVSYFQNRLSTAELKAFQFAFTRVSDGTGLVDANLKNNWDLISSAGIHRGGYHELRAGDGIAQAQYFLAALGKVGGPKPGDMLAVVASDYAGVTPAEVKAWCDHVKTATSGHCPVLVYTDLSMARTLGVCTGYPMWVAWPNPTAPSRAQIAPWGDWHIWQWGTRNVGGLGTVDADAFNGDAAVMDEWIKSYLPKPPAPDPDPTPPPAPPGTTCVVGDGKKSLEQICAEHKTTPQSAIWYTAQHRPHGFWIGEAGYFNAGGWTRPVPVGVNIWV